VPVLIPYFAIFDQSAYIQFHCSQLLFRQLENVELIVVAIHLLFLEENNFMGISEESLKELLKKKINLV
jgi:hypothetical protein